MFNIAMQSIEKSNLKNQYKEHVLCTHTRLSHLNKIVQLPFILCVDHTTLVFHTADRQIGRHYGEAVRKRCVLS